MKILVLILLPLLVVTAGCKKDRSHTSAEGVVIDATTQARVAGARVYLLQTKGTSLYASPSRVQHTDADALGKYSLSFEADEDSQYDLQATAPTFFDTPDTEYVSLSIGDKNKKNVTLRPEAWIRIRCTHGLPVNGNGAVEMEVSASNLLDARFSIALPCDTVLFVKCAGNTENRIAAGIYDGAPFRRTIDNIYCPAHDTTDYTIRF